MYFRQGYPEHAGLAPGNLGFLHIPAALFITGELIRHLRYVAFSELLFFASQTQGLLPVLWYAALSALLDEFGRFV